MDVELGKHQSGGSHQRLERTTSLSSRARRMEVEKRVNGRSKSPRSTSRSRSVRKVASPARRASLMATTTPRGGGSLRSNSRGRIPARVAEPGWRAGGSTGRPIGRDSLGGELWRRSTGGEHIASLEALASTLRSTRVGEAGLARRQAGTLSGARIQKYQSASRAGAGICDERLSATDFVEKLRQQSARKGVRGGRSSSPPVGGGAGSRATPSPPQGGGSGGHSSPETATSTGRGPPPSPR